MALASALDQRHFGASLRNPAPPAADATQNIDTLVSRLVPQKVMEGGVERSKPYTLAERSDFALVMNLSNEAKFTMKPAEESGPPVVRTENAPERTTNFLTGGTRPPSYRDELMAQGYEHRANVDYKAFRRSGMKTFEELVLRLQALNVDAQGIVYSRPGGIESEWRLYIRPSKPDLAS